MQAAVRRDKILIISPLDASGIRKRAAFHFFRKIPPSRKKIKLENRQSRDGTVMTDFAVLSSAPHQ
jgi:hypothetical protein